MIRTSSAHRVPHSGLWADGFDVVAVGIEHEGAVIVRVIHLAEARAAIVLAAGGDRRLVEGVDLRAALGAEGEMDMRRRLAAARNPEERLAVGTDAGNGKSAGDASPEIP